MKRLFIVPLILILVLLTASPALAQSGMDVDIGIVTPGDVDLDVGICAGGDIDITIDGVDFAQTANAAQEALDKINNRKGDGLWDFNFYYWKLSGIGRGVAEQISNIWSTINLLMESQAQLIQKVQELEQRIEALENH